MMERTRGPLALTVAGLIPILLWLATEPLNARFTDSATSLTSAAILIGLAGASLYAANLVLGARLRFVTAFFGGFERMYAVHRASGKIAFWLLVAHACGMFAGRAVGSWDAAFDLFVPADDWVTFYGVLALILIAITIILTLYVRLGHETFVYVHRIFGAALGLVALHVLLSPGVKDGVDAHTYFLAALFVAGAAGYVYRSVFGSVLVLRKTYRVSGARSLDPYVIEITMSPMEDPISFRPGQFIFVTFYSDEFNAQFHPFSVVPEDRSAIIALRPGDIREQFHPFSITSSPRERDLKVSVKAVGDYTTAMQTLRAGATARIEGPYGNFSYLAASSKKQVWLAGGIGITPFLSMARSLSDDEYEIDLFHGVKTRASAYFSEELAEIERSRPTFRLFLVPEDEMGFMTADEIEEHSGDLTRRSFLLCGPPPMVESLTQQLVRKGVAPNEIHFERFGFGPRI